MSSSPRKPTSRRGGRQTPGPGKKLGAPPSARGYVTLAPRVLPEHRAALDRLARRLGVGQAEALRALLGWLLEAENSSEDKELKESLISRLRAIA